MKVARELQRQITETTSKIIELGLSNEQRFPVLRAVGKEEQELTVQDGGGLALVLKNVEYSEIYEALESAGAFNIRMLDGGLIQLSYRIVRDVVVAHRLAFFPAPSLEAFQNDPEIYDLDELFADVLRKNVVPFPLRFDFDLRDDLHEDINHPKSHLTLGQYQNCRIPVTAPVGPVTFIRFLLRHFYNHAARKFDGDLPADGYFFASAITNNERLIPHFAVRHL